MNETVKLIGEYGGLVIMAAGFLYLVFRMLKHHEEQEARAHQASIDFIAALSDFKRVTSESNAIISNHLEHNTNEMRDITQALQKVCIYLELPNRDYKT